MLKINFAVWNMQGTNKNDQRFTAHRKKINMLLEYKINGKEPLDLVFFQEISNPETVFRENPSDRITRILSASVISFKKKKNILCFIGFWNIPPESDKKYQQNIKKTGIIIKQTFFQCNLQMASSGLLNAPEPTGITIRSLDGTPAGLAEEFETWNSDHLPLFFTVSVPDDNPGQ